MRTIHTKSGQKFEAREVSAVVNMSKTDREDPKVIFVEDKGFGFCGNSFENRRFVSIYANEKHGEYVELDPWFFSYQTKKYGKDNVKVSRWLMACVRREAKDTMDALRIASEEFGGEFAMKARDFINTLNIGYTLSGYEIKPFSVRLFVSEFEIGVRVVGESFHYPNPRGNLATVSFAKKHLSLPDELKFVVFPRMS